MNVYVPNVFGYEQAFRSMYMSKRSYSDEIERKIQVAVQTGIEARTGRYLPGKSSDLDSMLDKLTTMGRKHITVLRFLNFDIVTIGLHRAGQDDVDAHARRFDNRIIRASTRLADFEQDEFSDFYKDKVITTDRMVGLLNVHLPDAVNVEDTETGESHIYRKVPNGYVREEYLEDRDVKRGLYMMGIPSNFVAQINITEFAHVYKLRNRNTHANPEVREWAEAVLRKLQEKCPWFNESLMMDIDN